MKYLVSVIMPCYNMEKFLKRAVDSVIAQTYQPIELLIVDDGSTDVSLEIANDYSSKYNWIKVFKTSVNSGPSGARNVGLDHAKGDIIAFLDSDDYMFPSRLQKQVDVLTGGDYALCFSSYNRVDENDNPLGTVRIRKDEPSYDSLLGDPCICISTLAIAKYKIDRLPNFELGLRKAEDYYLYISLIKRGYKAKAIHEPLVNYSVISGSLSRQGLGCLPDMYKIYRDYEQMGWFKSNFLIGKYLYKASIRRSIFKIKAS